jgi:hypothetical protein
MNEGDNISFNTKSLENKNSTQENAPKITGDDVISEAAKIMKEIRQGKSETISSIKDYVNFDSIENSNLQRVFTQHSDYYTNRTNENTPKVIIGHDRTELVNEVYIVNESNLDITYNRKENKVNYSSSDSKPYSGIIRVVVPAWDKAANGQRLTGIQIKFNIGNKAQFKAFRKLNSELSGLKVQRTYRNNF